LGGDGVKDRALNKGRGVRGKVFSVVVGKGTHSLQQGDIAYLDQVQDVNVIAGMSLGNGYHHGQNLFDQVLGRKVCVLISRSNVPNAFHLLLASHRWNFAHF
jgi:hypothetical protein